MGSLTGADFCLWLISEVPTTSAPRPVYPQEWTRGWARESLCGDFRPGESGAPARRSTPWSRPAAARGVIELKAVSLLFGPDVAEPRAAVSWQGAGQPIMLTVYGPNGEVAAPLTPTRALALAVVNTGQLGSRYKCFFKRYMTVWNFEPPDGR